MKHPKYRGVYVNEQSPFNPYKAKWYCGMTVNGKTKKFIFSDNAEKCAREYDRWAVYYRKDKAKLNFPEEHDNVK